MLLTIDIGNTNIKCAVFDGERIVGRFYYPGPIAKWVKKIDKAIIVSVAPKKLVKLMANLKRLYKGRISLVGKDIKVPVRSEYEPKQIGQDRLVTAYAAVKMYGRPVLVIDFGTAVTFDVVSANGVYKGGLIFPGIKMSLESLHERTGLLPEVTLAQTKGLAGKNTVQSINNGVTFGYASVCHGLVKKFQKKFAKLKVIATGGNARFISKYFRGLDAIDEDLCLKGLRYLSDL